MNQNDGRDREVREYVRNRMAADMPPEFTRGVMNDVRRTAQRRRGFAWPLFAVLATVAAAVAVVAIGIGLLDQPDGIGSEQSAAPSTSVSPTAEHSPTPEATASAEGTPSPTAEPTVGDGEFGPVRSMSPEEAFDNGESCQVTNVLTTVNTSTDVGWTISFPDGWHTNDEVDGRSACTLFASEPIEFASDGTYPQAVEIVGNVPPGGDFSTGGEVIRSDAYTVDGVAAVRYEIAPSDGGFSSDASVLWVIAVGGNLPAEGNDRPYLMLSTGSSARGELAANVDILDRMVATLNLGE